MSPRPELSKPMTSVTAAASTSRKLTRTTASPSHWLNSERRNPMRNEWAADQLGPSALPALLATELPPTRLPLIVGARSLGYCSSRLFPPSQHASSVLPRPERRLVVKGPTQVGEERVVIDFSRGKVGEFGHACRHGNVM